MEPRSVRATFRVHRNEKQPFIVNTHHFDVRVFWARALISKPYLSDEVVSADVESGKVQVDSARKP
ncbi:MAG: hypothetical protein ACLUHA_13790 [Bacteroides stercoris]